MRYSKVASIALAIAGAVSGSVLQHALEDDSFGFPLEPRSARTFESETIEARQSTKNCVQGVHIIAAPGSGLEPPNLGLLTTLKDDIIEAIPSSDFVQLPYPLPQNSTDGKRITTIGARMLRNYIKKYTTSCPSTQIVLLGYSSGAIINMNALCGAFEPWTPTAAFPARYASNILALVLYGDQTRQVNQPYNDGTCTQSGGRYPRMNTANCRAFQSDFISYCDYQDPQCCSGSDQSQHYVYPSEYDDDAMEFVLAKWRAFKRSGQ